MSWLLGLWSQSLSLWFEFHCGIDVPTIEGKKGRLYLERWQLGALFLGIELLRCICESVPAHIELRWWPWDKLLKEFSTWSGKDQCYLTSKDHIHGCQAT